MPGWPKSLYTVGASLRSAATARRLRRSGAAVREQVATLPRLTSELARTTFWREAGVQAGMSYDEFRARVALRTPEHFEVPIGRMIMGEADVLWPGKCRHFAITAGLSSGAPRYVPVTEAMREHFWSAQSTALHYYAARTSGSRVFDGRHLHLGTTALTPIAEAKPHDALSGELSAIIATAQPAAAIAAWFEPPAPISSIAETPQRLTAIASGVTARDIALLEGTPSSALMLIEACRAGGRSISQRWPRLECFVHSGAAAGPYHLPLREAFGPAVHFHEVYPTAEGFIAAQDSTAKAGLRLIADAGLFFEFLPLADFEAARVEQLGPKAVPLENVKANVDYVLIATTPAGLARCVLGDIVRFISTEPPRLQYVARTQMLLHAFGEAVGERDLNDALVSVCERNSWTIVDFHVAPQLSPTMTGQNRGRHEWWLELKAGTVATPTGPVIAAAVDAELQRLNGHYATRRKSGTMDQPVVRLVMPGVFEHWLSFRGRSGRHDLTPRCRSDRTVADELAQITNFARD